LKEEKVKKSNHYGGYTVDKLIMEPYIGIGNVKLGMNMQEVHEAMGTDLYNGNYECNSYDEYFNYNLRVYYNDENIVNFIEAISCISNYVQLMFEGVDVFKTKADELISFIEENYDKYDRNNPESEFGYGYIFENVGLSFWRPNVFKEEDMKEEWFQELGTEQKEDEFKYLFFETAAVFSKGYYDVILKRDNYTL